MENITSKFSKKQKQKLKENSINIEKEFDEKSLEELEDKVYDKMMDSFDKNQDFTLEALEWERILDIIVEIENNY